MSNTINLNLNGKIRARETLDENINMPILFIKNPSTKPQTPLIDGQPDELYYNPSSKTLFVDNIETKIANLQSGEAIFIDNSVNNKTTVNVNFSENTDTTSIIADTDRVLISDTQNKIKTIRGDQLKSDIRLSAGANLSYGTSVNSNQLNLDSSITNTSLASGCTWVGNLIPATKLSNGSVSDADFQKLSPLTSAILESNDKGASNGVCPLDSNQIIPTQYLPGSVNDIIEVSNFASLPATGESSKIYVTLDNHKAYRWSGSEYVEISASLVIGTTSGTAYSGASGQTNANNIALKQDQLTFSSLGGLTLTTSGATKTLKVDINKTTSESSFDDNELMMIQKTNGNLCRITKQQLKSSINTNTEYQAGLNLSFDNTTTPDTINMKTALTDIVSVKSTYNADLTIQAGKSSSSGQVLKMKVNSTERARLTSSGFLITGGCDLTSGNLYKINNTQIDSSDILYDSSTTQLLKSKIDLKQDIISTSSTSGLALSSNNLTVDITKANVETSFDDNELMLIQKTNGNLAKITKQQLVSSLPTGGTTYQAGDNISIDTSTTPDTIKLSDSLDIEEDIKLHGDTTLRVDGTNNTDYNNVIKWQNTGSAHTIALCRRYVSGVGSNAANFTIQMGKQANVSDLAVAFVVRDNGNVNVGTSQTKSDKFNVEGTARINGNTTIDGTINCTTNTGVSVLHTMKIGAIGGADQCGFQYYGLTGSGDYAIQQNNSGDTKLNSSSGRSIYLRNNNVTVGSITNTQFKFGVAVAGTINSGQETILSSNKASTLRMVNNFTGTLLAGFINVIQQSLAYDTHELYTGYHKKGTMYPTATIGYHKQQNAEAPIWLNCVQSGSVEWNPGTKFAPEGQACIVTELFAGTRPQMSLTTGLNNNPRITVGRSQSIDYGLVIGGWNGGSIPPHSATIQTSGNFHIDPHKGGSGGSTGDIYLNLYGSSSANGSKSCRVYGFVNGSDRRIKNNFIPIDKDELLNQIENLELSTYNFKDPNFTQETNTLGFIADSLEGKSYFDNFVKITSYNMPFDVIDQIELDYTLNNNIITVSNYVLDLTKEYYYYAYKEDDSFLTIQNFPLSENSFKYDFEEEFVKLVVIGINRDDMKNIRPEKLVPGAYAGIQALIQKNKDLEIKVEDLETRLRLIEDKLLIS